ncbi:MAG: CarD family transcriptional regulator, partial [Planctomycetota bacterium]|nr:CarD family transcriptional regulator [Planctomycetota bacterium]
MAGLRAGDICHGSGLVGPSYVMVASTLAAEAPGSVLLVTTDGDGADDAVVDFRFFLEDATVEQFPAWESLPSPEVPPNKEILAERFEILSLLANPDRPNPKIIVAPIQAIQQPVVKPEVIAESYRTLKLDEDLPPAGLADWLVERAFMRLPQVDAPGEFSIRGGIMDIYPIGGAWPIRIEYFGDTIDSIRRFDPGNQRSTYKLEEFQLLAVDETKLHHLKPRESGLKLIDYMPGDTWAFIREPAAVQEKAQSAGRSEYLQKELYSYGALQKSWRKWPTLYLSEMPQSRKENHADFRVRSTERFTGEIDTVAAELLAAAVPNDKLYITCHNIGEKERLEELLEASPLATDPKLEYLVGDLTSGFEIDDFRMVFVTHHELFHHYTGPMRPTRARQVSAPLEDWLELEEGDLVVHLVHGIAQYHGMEAFERNGEMGEFLVLEFSGGSRIYVPVTHVELVQKYLGPAKTKPRLSKIGGKRWAKKKEDVQEAVEDLAVELLRLQAARESMPGHAYPPDDKWQLEFEAAFPFDATEDQVTATESIKDDLQHARPMDRLLCGDVGYGKTEVAMRTAFKTVMSDKQVAVLVPTTVLAEQHYRTFTERMGTFPVRIEAISRFKNKNEQKEILDAAAKGAVDILIGTHRIVQKDVKFRDLGLLVIDEEQRFGVEHKEFLKWLRQTVDVLTMTATPIPRTLHMSLVGIRDISALNTPPQDRQSIRSEVVRFDERLIRDAVLR